MTARAVGSPGGANPTPPSDSVDVSLPVKPFLAPEAVATSGEVAGDSTRAGAGVHPARRGPACRRPDRRGVALAGRHDRRGGQLRHAWPYESTEETISRFYPLLVLDKAYTAAGLTTPFSKDLPGLVSSSLQRLYADQTITGGWTWYPNAGTPSRLADRLCPAGDERGAGGGLPVSDRAVDQAHRLPDRLAERHRDQKRGDQPSRADTWATPNTRAYVLYALADSGAGDLALTRALAARSRQPEPLRPDLSRPGLPAPGRARRRQDAARHDRPAAAKQTSTTAHWEEAGQRGPPKTG